MTDGELFGVLFYCALSGMGFGGGMALFSSSDWPRVGKLLAFGVATASLVFGLFLVSIAHGKIAHSQQRVVEAEERLAELAQHRAFVEEIRRLVEQYPDKFVRAEPWPK